MTIDEIVARDNVPAATKTPEEIAERLSTRTVYLGGVGEVDEALKLIRAFEAHDGAVSLSLPESVSLGLPGRTGERVETTKLSVPAGERHVGEAFKPDWADLVYHPKLGGREPQRQLRRFDGRRVTPVNNQSFVYGSDQRQVYYPSGYPWRCIGKVDV